jgi:hypothetical protein
MAIVTMTLADLPPELTEEEIAELEAAEKMPITYDEDCPEMTEEDLKQFRRLWDDGDFLLGGADKRT